MKFLKTEEIMHTEYFKAEESSAACFRKLGMVFKSSFSMIIPIYFQKWADADRSLREETG